jgi:Zn-dependent oligopeptidase
MVFKTKGGVLILNRNLTGVLLAAALALTGCTNSNSTPHHSEQDSARKLSALTQLIKSDYKAGELTTLCDASIAKVQKRLDAIGTLKTEEATLDNTLLALEEALADFNDEVQPLTFMGYVSKDEAISAEGSACEEKLGQYFVGIYTRRDLYNVVRVQQGRTDGEKRLLSETLKSFELNGLKLSDEELKQVKDLNQSSLQKKQSSLRI